MDGIYVAFFVPMVIFLMFVAPIWVFMHYRYKGKQLVRREDGRTGGIDGAEIEELRRTARQLEGRVQSLERILDAEAAGWRDKT